MMNSTTPTDLRDEWRTPDEVFNYFDRLFGFDIDLAANFENTKCDSYFTAAQDALVQDWASFDECSWVGWCNPPYSNIDPWLLKALIEQQRGFTTVLLIPMPNGEARWERYIANKATEVWMISGRIGFLKPDGSFGPSNRFGSMAVVYRGHYPRGSTQIISIKREDIYARCEADESVSS